MTRNEALYREWLEFVGEFLQHPFAAHPRAEEAISKRLTASFNAACCSRSSVGPDWVDNMEGCWPGDYLPKLPPGPRVPDATWQPLLRWYAVSGLSGPQSLARVPGQVADWRMQAEWQDLARPLGIGFQLAIPLLLDGPVHRAYLLARPDREFDDDELTLAIALQPILTGLYRQLAWASEDTSTDGPGLTRRELAILGLLGQGLTATSLGHHFNISPRTAQKHLEHIYRKLDVGDRLMAVQKAARLGLLDQTLAVATNGRV
ncbi:response regulator transcription factor [Arthrobacter sp. NPDC057013]|uniref:helix-turn-helix transcriptional regulator n=1 Tax=Arthrobacter sp. NPDC057013 TaxID=3345999 RepID=UPI00362FE7C2